MDETLKRTIFETISEVFETMFFTFITPSAAFPEDPGLLKKADFIEAVITFTCKTEGKVTIYFPRALAKDITVNFLGLEEGEVEERQVIDTMRETICFQLLFGQSETQPRLTHPARAHNRHQTVFRIS